MAEQIIQDADEYVIYGEDRPGVTTRRVVPRPGTAAANRDDIMRKAQQALTVNDNYLGVASPTNAQVAAQVKTLTRECSGVIRLLLGALDTTDGT